LIVRRNILFVLMSLEIMMNASALAFVVAGSRWAQPDEHDLSIRLSPAATGNDERQSRCVHHDFQAHQHKKNV
ncbi:NADH-quinone oxidoreductase subunit K, partial [Pseudomonas quasicaspiana]|nr:NADH-quinone oxidoreductase subunit K [Pseudomonas quasicaspiana]